MDLALVDVWPFRSSAEEDAPLVAPQDDYGFFSNDIGGVVHGELNITEGEGPYVVKRSIYVDGYVLRRKQLGFLFEWIEDSVSWLLFAYRQFLER